MANLQSTGIQELHPKKQILEYKVKVYLKFAMNNYQGRLREIAFFNRAAQVFSCASFLPTLSAASLW